MKTFRNLMLLLVTVSLLSSCLVREQRGGHHRERHGHGRYDDHHH